MPRKKRDLVSQSELSQKEIKEVHQILEKIKAEIEAVWKKRLEDQRIYYQTKHQEMEKKYQDMEKALVNEIQKAEDKIRTLENKIREQNGIIDGLIDSLNKLKTAYRKLQQPPLAFARVLKLLPNERVAIIDNSGQPMVVTYLPEIANKLKPGQEVLIRHTMSGIIVVGISDILNKGDIGQVQEVIDEYRVVLNTVADQKKVVYLSEKAKQNLQTGDLVRWDIYTNFVLEKVQLQSEKELQELELETVPNITFEQIGGLGPQLEKIKQEFVWPIIYRDEFSLHKCLPIKGGLLVGPPGCGKTLIAKALANYMAKLLAEKQGRKDVKGYFICVGGPQLSNKYVGETERRLRELFQKAKKQSESGFPVVIFFDEVESFLRIRGSGISSDAKDDYVTQFNVILDGMTDLGYVLVLAATNRPDMVDPAVMREGRLELKLEINRPDKEGTKEIFRIYLTPDLPLHPKYQGQKPEEVVEKMINKVADYLFARNSETEFMEVTYHDGSKEMLYFDNFVSGAIIKGIVDRTKTKSIIRKINGQERGITEEDLLIAAQEIFIENKHLVDIHALYQEFVFRPGKTPVSVKSLIEEKLMNQKKGKLSKEKDRGII